MLCETYMSQTKLPYFDLKKNFFYSIHSDPACHVHVKTFKYKLVCCYLGPQRKRGSHQGAGEPSPALSASSPLDNFSSIFVFTIRFLVVGWVEI